MTWDPLQHEILEALGHTVYRTTGRASGGVPDDALLHALLRAAGRDVDAADAAALCREWMPTARLRDPAAKRALWPRLRSLRASTPPR